MSNGDLNWITNFIWGIADVVTGKLDVRDAAAALPEIVDDAAPFDDADEDEEDALEEPGETDIEEAAA